jgi:nucleotide-binding universal stress UspA family protein
VDAADGEANGRLGSTLQVISFLISLSQEPDTTGRRDSVAALRPVGGLVMTAAVLDITDRIPARSPVPDHVVVGVDGTESSLRALDVAATIARRNESQVSVVFVRHPPATSSPMAVDWSTIFDPLQAEIADAARERLAGLRWRLLVVDGSPARELERIATDEGADLLVVGRSHGGLIHRLLEGSVAEHAATHAPVAVLVVR